MGRRNFKPKNRTISIPLSISLCTSIQFSCNSGQCVEIDQVCNYLKDCKDGSDEFNCNFTSLRPTVYDKGLYGSLDRKVGIRLALRRLVEVNMDEGTVSIDLKHHYCWTDDRVQFTNIHIKKKVFVALKDIGYYWQPLVLLRGVIGEHALRLSAAKDPDIMTIKAFTRGNISIIGSTEGNQTYCRMNGR